MPRGESLNLGKRLADLCTGLHKSEGVMGDQRGRMSAFGAGLFRDTHSKYELTESRSKGVRGLPNMTFAKFSF